MVYSFHDRRSVTLSAFGTFLWQEQEEHTPPEAITKAAGTYPAAFVRVVRWSCRGSIRWRVAALSGSHQVGFSFAGQRSSKKPPKSAQTSRFLSVYQCYEIDSGTSFVAGGCSCSRVATICLSSCSNASGSIPAQ